MLQRCRATVAKNRTWFYFVQCLLQQKCCETWRLRDMWHLAISRATCVATKLWHKLRDKLHSIKYNSALTATHVKTHKLLQTWSMQTCFNNLSTGCVRTACSQIVVKLSTACSQLATSLLSSTDLLQVVPTTCYRPEIHQFVNRLWMTTL